MDTSIHAIQRDSLRRFETSIAEKTQQIRDEIEPETTRLKYEQQIAQRLLKKATTDAERANWEIQVSVYHDILVIEEGKRAELEEQIAQDRAMIAEIRRDLVESPDEAP
jgi:hypothetical protein